MKANHKHYILLVLSILAFASAIAGYWALYYTVTYHGRESSEVLSKQVLVDEKRQYTQQVESIYEKTASDRALISSHSVTADKVVDFIEIIEQIGTTTSSATVISAIDINEGFLKAHMEMKGSWSDIMKALVLVENIPYSIALNNIRLIKSAESAENLGAGSWVLSADIKTPVIK